MTTMTSGPTPDEAADDAIELERFQAERSWLMLTDTGEYLYQWENYERRHDALGALERGEHTAAAQQMLDATADVSVLAALSASRTLIDLLMERRWYAIQDAREEGHSWTTIGAMLGMTKQGAHDWYRRAIARRAEIDDRHDGERAQRVL